MMFPSPFSYPWYRVFLGGLSVFVSSFVFVMIVLLYQGIQEYQQEQTRRSLGGDMMIQQSFVWNDQEMLCIDTIASQQQTALSIQTQGLVRIGEDTIPVSVLAVSDGFPLYNPVSQPLKETEVFLPLTLREKYGLSYGDSVLLGKESFIVADFSEPPSYDISFYPTLIVSIEGGKRSGIFEKQGRVQYRLFLEESIDTPEQCFARSRIRTLQEGMPQFENRINNISLIVLYSGYIVVIFGIVSLSLLMLSSYRDSLPQQNVLSFVGMRKSLLLRNSMYSLYIAFYVSSVIFLVLIPVLYPVMLTYVQSVLPFAFQWSMGKVLIVTAIQSSIVVFLGLVFSLSSALFRGIVFLGTLICIGFIIGFSLEVFGVLVFVVFCACIVYTSIHRIIPPALSSVPRTLFLHNLHSPQGGLRAFLTLSVGGMGTLFFLFGMIWQLSTTLEKTSKTDAPSFVALDIQPHQVEYFASRSSNIHPIVRARITHINTQPLSSIIHTLPSEIEREFNLTYRDDLNENEGTVRGRLWDKGSSRMVISVSEEESERFQLPLFSTVTFLVQGVSLTFTVEHIHSIDTTSFSPFFYFITPYTILSSAPQSSFAFLPTALSQEEQRFIQQTMPNISFLHPESLLSTFQMILRITRGVIIVCYVVMLLSVIGVFVASMETMYAEIKKSMHVLSLLGVSPFSIRRYVYTQGGYTVLILLGACVFFGISGVVLVMLFVV